MRSPAQPDGRELLLEPSAHRAVGAYRAPFVEDGIPAAQFAVEDVHATHERLRDAGVDLIQEPMGVGGGVVTAVFDDTCGNLVQIASTG